MDVTNGKCSTDVNSDGTGTGNIENGIKITDNVDVELMISSNNRTTMSQNSNTEDCSQLLYGVEESPPPLTTLLLAFQNLFLAFGGCIVVSFTLADLGCVEPDHPIRSKLFCSALFMVGLTTAAQSAFGIRLPVLQGVSAAFLVPLVTLKTSGVWSCPDIENRQTGINATNNSNASGVFEQDEIIYTRLRELQGSLMLASITEIFLGCTGLVGFLLRFIRPITIAVTITLLGLTLAPIPVKYCDTYWPAAIVTIILMTVFSTYLSSVRITIPTCRKNKTTQAQGLPVFQLFSVLMAFCCGWLLCYVLTVTNVLSDDPSDPSFFARTDSSLDIVHMTPWISITYPGQFGTPSFSIAAFFGYLAAFIASEMESIGDYMAVADVCQNFPPPKHAVNRGIMFEGLLACLSGSIGTGHATTSYTANIAIIKFTRVASRSVMILAGVLAIILSIIGKFGAGMSLMPYPAIGGVYLVVCGTITAVGVSSLKAVDMTSSRNTAVFGISVYTGYIFSEWVKTYPDRINTGTLQLDQVLKVFLGTPMFLGSLVAVFLDNTIPDKKKIDGEDHGNNNLHTKHYKAYEFQLITPLQQRFPCLRRLPFLQPYNNN